MRNIIFIYLMLSPPAFAAGDPVQGKLKSATCTACHGANGLSANSFWPNLAGQKEEYLAKQIKAFRDGSRNDPLMSPVSKMFTDQDAADLASYFANLGEKK